MTSIINGEEIDPVEGILHHEEGVDLILSTIPAVIKEMTDDESIVYMVDAVRP